MRRYRQPRSVSTTGSQALPAQSCLSPGLVAIRRHFWKRLFGGWRHKRSADPPQTQVLDDDPATRRGLQLSFVYRLTSVSVPMGRQAEHERPRSRVTFQDRAWIVCRG